MPAKAIVIGPYRRAEAQKHKRRPALHVTTVNPSQLFRRMILC